MTPEEYDAKRKARYLRLLTAAERAEREGDAYYKESDRMASVIPMGQPILVGHYSEGRDRRYRERIHQKMRKGYELHQKATHLRRRAEAAQRNAAIFSDDPQASEKLEAKIQRLEARQEMMKKANKLVRKNDREGLADMGFSEPTIDRLFLPDYIGRVGFPDYLIRNNGANIRRLKERLTHIEAHANDETSEKVFGDIRIVDNPEANRVQIFFPDKPSDEVRAKLKSHGFRWTPSAGCWQAHRSNGALYWAERIVKGD